MRLIECVPNLSEGRDTSALDRLWQGLNRIPALQCLHRNSDRDHHRTVLTLAGPAEAIREAACRMLDWCQQQIDLRQHQGVHPRIGALDVLPLVALEPTQAAFVLHFAQELAAELAAGWQLPIYLYEQSAKADYRRALPDIRRGGFEQLAQKMRDSLWLPDYGPASPHPQLGATVMGVRSFLIAWNVFLDSSDLKLAQAIAAQIRERNGGFVALRALGFYLPERQQIQVSMNLLDYRQSSMHTIMQAIQQLADAAGVRVLRSEFIGLVPQDALTRCALDYLRSGDQPQQRVLETFLKPLS